MPLVDSLIEKSGENNNFDNGRPNTHSTKIHSQRLPLLHIKSKIGQPHMQG